VNFGSVASQWRRQIPTKDKYFNTKEVAYDYLKPCPQAKHE
jgi:hypothetical protein